MVTVWSPSPRYPGGGGDAAWVHSTPPVPHYLPHVGWGRAAGTVVQECLRHSSVQVGRRTCLLGVCLCSGLDDWLTDTLVNRMNDRMID